MLNIVLFGGPGAGKGTQALLLTEKFGLRHLSTGDMLRKEIASGSELGKIANGLISNGELAPDELVIDMIREHIEQNSEAKGFIFDGFPRTQAQAQALDKLLNEKNVQITAMIALDVSVDELTTRLLKRGEVSGRTDDRSIDIIHNRIEVYHRKTEPVIDYYRAQKKYYPVDGLGSIEEIFSRLKHVILTLKPHAFQHPIQN
ncbi:MAG: adenylate kinase [Bacteroidales bacterium]|jgi:adenylate kinase|nr:adenylate kinase [Bacteroidales bacterium]